MVDCLSERVNLRKRVEVVHNSGQPDDEESCNIMARALWAVPLFLITDGLRSASQHLSACCAAGPRRSYDVERISVDQESEARNWRGLDASEAKSNRKGVLACWEDLKLCDVQNSR